MRPNIVSRGIRRAKRVALSPFRSAGVPLNENDRRIKALHNVHAGRRAFVLGNGPSLKVSDLDRLKGEITFAANRIFLAFEQTEWRPTYYSVCDEFVAERNRKEIANLKLTKVLSNCVENYVDPSDDYIWLRELPVSSLLTEHPFSKNLLVGVYGGGTVTYEMIQLAFYMGITELYLLGLDFSFALPNKQVDTTLRGPEKILESQGEQNHFHPDYRKAGEGWAMPNMPAQERAYRTAKRVFEEAGGSIINTSRKTKLEVFPLKSFDEVVLPR